MTTSIDVFPSRSRFNQSLYTMFLSCNKIDAHSNSFLTESAGSNPVKRTSAFLAEWFTQLTENQSFSMLEASSFICSLDATGSVSPLQGESYRFESYSEYHSQHNALP